MSGTEVNRNLAAVKEALERLKDGDKRGARTILIQVLKENPRLEIAWYTLSFALPGRDEQIFALRQALNIDPSLEVAISRLAKLKDQAEGEHPTPIGER